MASAASEHSWQGALDRCIPCIVVVRVSVVRSFDGHRASFHGGTGFVVNARKGLLLTNRHIVTAGPVKVDAVFSNKEEVELTPIYVDPVHDFAFCAFNPDQLKFSSSSSSSLQGQEQREGGEVGQPPRLREIELDPDGARVGREIRVVGNDNGEKISILPGFLARLDREAPHYGGGGAYSDCNTFYHGAASSSSGGSSGSPVLTVEGKAVSLNCGAAREAASSYFLPLHRIQRALQCLLDGQPVTRGTLFTVFKHMPFDELRRLGLSEDVERRARSRRDGETGMLTVHQVLPGGPAEGRLEPGDILLAVNGHMLTDFAAMEAVFDDNVGQPIHLSVQRQSETVSEIELVPADLCAAQPNEYVEISAAVLHPLSYLQARNEHTRINEGVYIAHAGYMLARAGVSPHSILRSVAGKPISTIDDVVRAFDELRDGQRVAVQCTRFTDKHAVQTAVVIVDKRWFPFTRYRRTNASGVFVRVFWQTGVRSCDSRTNIPLPALAAAPPTPSLTTTTMTMTMTTTTTTAPLHSAIGQEDGPSAPDVHQELTVPEEEERTEPQPKPELEPDAELQDLQEPAVLGEAPIDVEEKRQPKRRRASSDTTGRVGVELGPEMAFESHRSSGNATRPRAASTCTASEVSVEVARPRKRGRASAAVAATAAAAAAASASATATASASAAKAATAASVAVTSAAEEDAPAAVAGSETVSPIGSERSRWFRGMVKVSFFMPYVVEGASASMHVGIGMLLDVRRGLVLIDRTAVPCALGDVILTFQSSVEVNGAVVFVHPVHNFCFVQYDPLDPALDACGPGLLGMELSPEYPTVGQEMEFFGLTSQNVSVRQSSRITKIDSLNLSTGRVPQYMAVDVEVCFFDKIVGCNGGAFIDSTGCVAAFWLPFSYQSGANEKKVFRGLPACIVRDSAEVLQRGQRPRVLSLGAKMSTMGLARARVGLGLPDAWCRQIQDHGLPDDHKQVLIVRRRMAQEHSVVPSGDHSPAAQSEDRLQDGDVVLAVNGRLVCRHRELDTALSLAVQDAHSAQADAGGSGEEDADEQRSQDAEQEEQEEDEEEAMRAGDAPRPQRRQRQRQRQRQRLQQQQQQQQQQRQPARRSSVALPDWSIIAPRAGADAHADMNSVTAAPEVATVTVVRNQTEMDLRIRLTSLPTVGTDRVVLWGGLMLHNTHLAVLQRGYSPPDGGVYISRWICGSPAHKFGIRAMQWLVRVNQRSTRTLDDFCAAVKELSPTDPVRLSTLDLSSKPHVFTLKQDSQFWPMLEVRRVETSTFGSYATITSQPLRLPTWTLWSETPPGTPAPAAGAQEQVEQEQQQEREQERGLQCRT